VAADFVVAAKPSMTGIWQSIRITSKSSACTECSASSPLQARLTSRPSLQHRAGHFDVDRIVFRQQHLARLRARRRRCARRRPAAALRRGALAPRSGG
jgi:hypothetical protein